MSTSTDSVRNLIADDPRFHQETLTADGRSIFLQVSQHPILSIVGLTLPPGAAYVHLPSESELAFGLIIFSSAPAEGDKIHVAYKHAILTDAIIQNLLNLNGADIYAASADALDAVATNEALLQKRITLGDLSTDGPSVARSLRDHAAQLRALSSQNAGIEVAEQVQNQFSYREQLVNDMLRSG